MVHSRSDPMTDRMAPSRLDVGRRGHGQARSHPEWAEARKAPSRLAAAEGDPLLRPVLDSHRPPFPKDPMESLVPLAPLGLSLSFGLTPLAAFENLAWPKPSRAGRRPLSSGIDASCFRPGPKCTSPILFWTEYDPGPMVHKLSNRGKGLRDVHDMELGPHDGPVDELEVHHGGSPFCYLLSASSLECSASHSAAGTHHGLWGTGYSSA